MSLEQLNNRAAALIASGKLDEAEAVLARVQARLPGTALDEYFYRVHRVVLGWMRERYADAIGDAERAYALEVGELASSGFATGAWGRISLLTRCKRFDEARDVFAEVVAAKELWRARRTRDAAAAEKILVAGLCIAFESTTFKPYRKLVRAARALGAPDSANLAYAYACFFALAGDLEPAFEMLQRALSNGYAVEKVIDDEDLRALRADDRYENWVIARVRPWKITSGPPGARIWIDGVDTGAVTPARVKSPGRGIHRVRLVLDGHADDEVDIEAESLELGRCLESLASIAEKQRMIDDGMTPPSDAARDKTRAFVGDSRRARVTVERHTTYGLGGLAITIGGDGRTTIDKTTFFPTDRPVHHETRVDAAPIFAAFIAEAFTELVIAPHTGVPDELYVSITLHGAGGTHRLGKFASAKHLRFERLVALVREACKWDEP